MTLAAYAPMPAADETRPETLTPHELSALAATAQTQADHGRIAEYYRLRAQDYVARANVHQAMVASYRAYPATTGREELGMICHCENFAHSLREQAAKAEDLARLHDGMAREAAE